MKTYIILFNAERFANGRKMAEKMESTTFDFDTSNNSERIRDKVIEYFKLGYGDGNAVDVYPITDFMDEYNDDRVNSEGTYMSYVQAK